MASSASWVMVCAALHHRVRFVLDSPPGNTDSVAVPTFCRLMRDAAADVACGKDHTLALTSTGGLFAWGSNKDGRLGLGHTQTLYEPSRFVLSRAFISRPSTQ
jgi:alpha-tubulin suppressor-like RCC1 family protein